MTRGVERASPRAASSQSYARARQRSTIARRRFSRSARRDAVLHDILERLLPRADNAANVNAIKNFSILPDLSHTISQFNGEIGAQSAREWIEGIEGIARLHLWPKNFALETARTHLTDGARDWCRWNRHDITDWNAFPDLFRGTFVLPESFTVKWSRMEARSQGKKRKFNLIFSREGSSVSRCEFRFSRDERTSRIKSLSDCGPRTSVQQWPSINTRMQMNFYERCETSNASKPSGPIGFASKEAR